MDKITLTTVIRLPLGEYFVIGRTDDGKRVNSRRFSNYTRMRERFASEGYSLPLAKSLKWTPGVCGSKEAQL